MSSTHTVLYITDDLATVDLTAWKLEGTGLEFVSTTTSDAVALFFVNRRVEAVVLDKRREPQAAVDLARVLKSFRDIPVILVSANSIDSLPNSVDACVRLDDFVGEVPRLIEAMLKLSYSAHGRSNDPFARNNCACLQEQQPFPEEDSRH